jgi:NAD(P)-dependent dehydrogenase (short-subunit alcohol dehydrogenase family)
MASMHILVTGSTDGIGSATAEALVRTGHVVYIHGRNADKVARKVATGAARGFVADLASLEETARLAREVAEAVPELDVLTTALGALDATTASSTSRWPATATRSTRISRCPNACNLHLDEARLQRGPHLVRERCW